MAVTTRIDSIVRDIELIISADLSPEAVSKAIGGAARDLIADAQETNTRALGSSPPQRVYVDGREGAPLESVKPVGGTILAEFDLLEDSLRWIGQQLVLHSPVRTGKYANSHILFLDGEEMNPNDPIPPTFGEIVFLNTQPYARKIERGLSDQAPDGVYEAVAALAKRRFGNIVNIRFTYRAFSEGGIMAYVPVQRVVVRDRRGRFKPTGLDRTVQKRERSLRSPAIVLTRG